MPPTSVIGEIVQALCHAPTAIIYRSICCAHIPGKQDTYPLWIVSYWAELRPIREARQRWDSAVRALETRIQRNTSDLLGPAILDRILAMPWYSRLRGFHECEPEGVISFCKPTAWLKTTEIDQMLELLDNDVELRNRSIRVLPSGHAREIKEIHQNEGLEYETSPKYRKLRELGENIANGGAEQFATVANVGGDHWIALIVNFTSKAVYYFDSLKQPIDSELREAYDWWILQHHGTEFGWVTLPCLRQLDGHNCGLFAANRVAYYIDQDAYPLLDPQGCDDERLNTLAKILDRHDVTVSFLYDEVQQLTCYLDLNAGR
ncbi:hypothetical protein K438DRAFT_1605694 [Mycena galopus ATCC 62051]|nr:hypothetical protein K438DRAFT_1605694 [Mycena galopus ATCC 62051]